MGHLSRHPTSNDRPLSKKGKSPWLGESEFVDVFALRLGKLTKLCVGCKRETHVNNLDCNQHCPDCR